MLSQKPCLVKLILTCHELCDKMLSKMPTPPIRGSRSQEQRILWLLQSSYPSWVPATTLAAISLQYNARIFSLRRKGWQIANKVEVQPDGMKHGYFRFSTPKTWPNPVQPGFRADEFNRVTGTLFADLVGEHRDDG
jgi:hypothetical protein